MGDVGVEARGEVEGEDKQKLNDQELSAMMDGTPRSSVDESGDCWSDPSSPSNYSPISSTSASPLGTVSPLLASIDQASLNKIRRSVSDSAPSGEAASAGSASGSHAALRSSEGGLGSKGSRPPIHPLALSSSVSRNPGVHQSQPVLPTYNSAARQESPGREKKKSSRKNKPVEDGSKSNSRRSISGSVKSIDGGLMSVAGEGSGGVSIHGSLSMSPRGVLKAVFVPFGTQQC